MPRRYIYAPVARVRTEDGWDRGLDEPLVRDLVETPLGVLDPLVVTHGWDLKDGRLRLKALQLRKVKKHWILVLDKADDAEAVKLELKLVREHLAPGEVAKLRALLVDRRTESGSSAPTKEVAEAAGVTRRTVQLDRQATESFTGDETKALDAAKVPKKARVKLARKLEGAKPGSRRDHIVEVFLQEQAKPKPPRAKPKPKAVPKAVDGLGRPIPDELRKAFDDAHRLYHEPAAAIREALKGTAAAADPRGDGYGGTRLGREVDLLRKRALTIADELDGLAPFSTCPHCKLVPTKRSGCGHCEKRGWVGRTAWLRAPVELQACGELAKIYVPGPKGTPILTLVSGLPGGGR